MIKDARHWMQATWDQMRASWKLASGQCTVCATPLRDDAKKYSQCSEVCEIEAEMISRAW